MMALAHFMTLFFADIPPWVLGCLSVCVLLSGFPLMAASFQNATIIFLAAGSSLLAMTHQPFDTWNRALSSMTNTVALMAAMQLVAIPVSLGGYARHIQDWVARRVTSNRALFLYSSVVTHLLASVLNMGAIAVSINLLEPTVRSRLAEKSKQFLSAAISRGYVMAALWAPPAINLYLVTEATGVPWSALAVPGIVFVGICFLLSLWIEERKGGSLEGSCLPSAVAPHSYHSESADPLHRTIVHLPVAVIAMVVIVLLLELLHIGKSHVRIMTAGMVTAAIWTLLQFEPGRFRQAVREYWDDGLLKVRDLGPFFVAMGMFSSALSTSGLLVRIQPAVLTAASWLGLASVVVLPLLVIALSLIGFHPFITIVMTGNILASLSLPIPMVSIAVSLAIGGAAAYMISPFAGIIMSLSRYTRAPASRISITWNGRYSLLVFAAGMVFAIAWGMIFGGSHG